ncbi:MAG TPA: glutamate-1-semialdehyde 2,1-aminomutase [Candidatus Bathyarchaeia archaeon]|nr:glutamate-1-semialdehyde 2,1-aminomutase [Candidatus Bathyarchaeia archaeon]
MSDLSMRTSESEKLFEKARKLMPGGVSSPVRAIDPYPFYVKRASDSRIWDVDGNLYIDYCMGYGPLILGHAHPAVYRAVVEQLKSGWDYGTPLKAEIDLAERIQADFPSMEMLRFVSTGAEATMSAIRVARGFTGKSGIVKIEGGYHGAHDAVLVKSGRRATTTASSLGVPAAAVKHTAQVPFNDVEALSSVLEKRNVACLIIEPVMGNIGPVVPEETYLNDVRKVTEENETLLVFDEVITGFRLCVGGAQCLYDVTPDITTLGKIVGGGFPVGVFGGKREIMECVAPSGGVFNAGTFSGHPVSLAAGLATLNVLNEEGYRRVNGLGDLLRRMISDLVAELNVHISVQGIGTMFQIFFTEKPVRNYQDALTCDTELYKKFSAFMRDEGIFLAPSQFETNFISLAHSNEDLEYTIRACANAFERLYGLDVATPGY